MQKLKTYVEEMKTSDPSIYQVKLHFHGEFSFSIVEGTLARPINNQCQRA